MGSTVNKKIRSRIIGVGAALPKKIVTNKDLAQTIDTSDEWIVERTGIKERRIEEQRKQIVWNVKKHWIPHNSFLNATIYLKYNSLANKTIQHNIKLKTQTFFLKSAFGCQRKHEIKCGHSCHGP